MAQQIKSNLKEAKHGYTSLDIRYEEDTNLAWYFMHARPRPCFSFQLVSEIQHWFNELEHKIGNHEEYPDYVVMASEIPGVYNLGGDLELFIHLIRNGDRDGLMRYALACNDILFRNHTGHGGEITTIALVQGDTLGGGFEAAVSSHVVIAERGAKMGLPDILFNLFPGAGAYALLSRKVGAITAERIILSGRLYTAEEMHELGIVDILVAEGEGRKAVYDYVKKENRLKNGYRAFRQAKRCSNPVTEEELIAAAKIWVETAFRLSSRDLRMMERLVLRQSAKAS